MLQLWASNRITRMSSAKNIKMISESLNFTSKHKHLNHNYVVKFVWQRYQRANNCNITYLILHNLWGSSNIVVARWHYNYRAATFVKPHIKTAVTSLQTTTRLKKSYLQGTKVFENMVITRQYDYELQMDMRCTVQ